jgi:hypothetical protein
VGDLRGPEKWTILVGKQCIRKRWIEVALYYNMCLKKFKTAIKNLSENMALLRFKPEASRT